MPSDASGTSPDAGLLSPVGAGTAAWSASTDTAWLDALVAAEAALARAQARLGLIPAEAAAAIDAAARRARFDPAEIAEDARGGGNPVIPLVSRLRASVGTPWADHVHAGATSQDIMDTATMTVVGRVRDLIVADLDGVVAGAMDLARRHRTTPMAARTLGMQAVPTTFGLVAAGWMVTCDEAREGLRRLEPPAQLGGAAGTLAATGPVGLLAAFAAETGLAEPVLPWHTDRAPIIAAASALAGVTAALGKAATDVVRLSATEVAEVAEPARAGRGGSSAMPHKRNPVLATMIRSAALQVPGLAQILMSAALAPLQRPAGEWHAEWEPLRSCLRLAGGGAATGAELLHGLEVFPARMCANMRPELMSEHVALALAPAIGRDAARRVAARAAAAGRPLADALPAALTDEGLPDELPGDLLSELLDPAAATGRAPELVDRAIAAVAARS